MSGSIQIDGKHQRNSISIVLLFGNFRLFSIVTILWLYSWYIDPIKPYSNTMAFSRVYPFFVIWMVRVDKFEYRISYRSTLNLAVFSETTTMNGKICTIISMLMNMLTSMRVRKSIFLLLLLLVLDWSLGKKGTFSQRLHSFPDTDFEFLHFHHDVGNGIIGIFWKRLPNQSEFV